MKMEEEVHSDDDLVELIRLGDEKAADELINAIIDLSFIIAEIIASIRRKQKI